jgi:hypothetical protein
MGQAWPVWFSCNAFSLVARKKYINKHRFATKTILAVSSIESCQSIFDESDIERGLSGGSSHGAMIPPLLHPLHDSRHQRNRICQYLLISVF